MLEYFTWRKAASYLFPTDKGLIKVTVHIKITKRVDTKLRSNDIGYYYMFLGKESAEALRDYIEWRMNNGEQLTPEIPLFMSSVTAVTGKQLREGSIREIVKRYVRDTGLDPTGI